MNSFYRIIIIGDLVQESAFAIGGNQPHKLVDLPLARDGRDRPVLRGSSLAGVFIDTARRILGHQLPAKISLPGNSKNHTPSRWQFEHSHLRQTSSSVFRQHVSIDPQTGAAADDHLFNLEAIPRNQKWGFHLEIVPQPTDSDAEKHAFEALALLVMREWSNLGGCRLGRGSGHGYGWLHLENLHIWRLEQCHAKIWPNAELDIQDLPSVSAYFAAQQIAPLDLACYGELLQAEVASLDCHSETVVELGGIIAAGERTDDFGAGYGLDSLSIGGHAQLMAQSERWFSRINKPHGWEMAGADFKPDFVITADSTSTDHPQPYIPGASIRGVWRAALNRRVRAEGRDSSLIDQLFGSTEQAGAISLADAYPLDNDWVLAWQQHIAIDELTGGAYESCKFDRLALLQARFGWRARIATTDQVQATTLLPDLERMLTVLGETGHLPLGGGQWRGHGHVRWQLKPPTTRKLGELA